MEPHFQRVTILGVGLIGGSLALDLKEKGIAEEIVGVGRSRENLELALSRGVIDRFEPEPESGVKDADLVVLAAPVGAIIALGKKIIPQLKKGAILTDVGSVKSPIVRELEPALKPGVAFVPGHPLAGSEKGGAGAARAGLFAGNRVILTPTPKTDPEATATVRRLWEKAGSQVFELDPGAHDLILAAVSHLPHAVSASLVQAVCRRFSGEEVKRTGAGSFRDLSRVSASPPELWRDILSLNREPMLEILADFRKRLAELETYIREGQSEKIFEFFSEAKKHRDAL
ncbi:MAG: prephenate dehydrogenase/arogenate dehydrogenase family protein [Proteobacteria bacterium]|nr:prephenate dehydrogenase/arogenate dehydrogenase family protein [Pseudomonadota bacterium]